MTAPSGPRAPFFHVSITIETLFGAAPAWPDMITISLFHRLYYL